MRTLTLMSAVSTNTSSAVQTVLGSQRENYVVQLVLTGTASVAIEGSFNGTSFHTLNTLTASDVVTVISVPYLRATTSGTAGASVTIFVGV